MGISRIFKERSKLIQQIPNPGEEHERQFHLVKRKEGNDDEAVAHQRRGRGPFEPHGIGERILENERVAGRGGGPGDDVAAAGRGGDLEPGHGLVAAFAGAGGGGDGLNFSLSEGALVETQFVDDRAAVEAALGVFAHDGSARDGRHGRAAVSESCQRAVDVDAGVGAERAVVSKGDVMEETVVRHAVGGPEAGVASGDKDLAGLARNYFSWFLLLKSLVYTSGTNKND